MTDETRDPNEGPKEGEPERRLPARRPPSEPAPPPTRSTERFTASRQTHAIGGLTSERAARIVRQSGDARWVAFLGMVIVALFVIIYYFYELGTPIANTKPRLEAQDELQQVTAIERGYNLYQANCARCHGANGEGGIGPVLNDQMRLFSHLNEQYLHNVLTVGGRYVCGNPKSVMPVWSDENGGPLNYVQIEDLIAFLRAPNTDDYTIRDPELNEPVLNPDGTVRTFRGWLDPAFKPDAAATPVPDCWSGTPGGGTPAPQETLGPDARVLDVVAENIAFDPLDLTAPADEQFGIHLDQRDAGVGGHDVDIRSEDGTKLADNPVLVDPGETTYTIAPLAAGTYQFFCSVHPIPQMTGTLTVE
jgi:mono/diheme cytochrome c family protein/plastocyanin